MYYGFITSDKEIVIHDKEIEAKNMKKEKGGSEIIQKPVLKELHEYLKASLDQFNSYHVRHQKPPHSPFLDNRFMQVV